MGFGAKHQQFFLGMLLNSLILGRHPPEGWSSSAVIKLWCSISCVLVVLDFPTNIA